MLKPANKYGCERVLEFVAANPMTTVREIHRGVSLPSDYVSMTLTRLKKRQKVDAIRVEGSRIIHWQLSGITEEPAPNTEPGALRPGRRAMLAYIAANPQCSTQEVAKATKGESRHMGSELLQMARWGYLIGVKEGRRMYWTATGKTAQDQEKGTVPRQIVTQSWVAPQIAGHWLDFALAGREQVTA